MKLRIVALICLLLCSALSCTPYLLQAGWEEANILLKREKIASLVKSNSIDTQTKEKLSLVLSVRSFTETLGLKPARSFTYYSQIDRDVLVWVLAASKKTSFTPTTWWFPIVGRVPYKGFFDKEDGVREAQRLQKANLDIYLRGSVAFSTLGWFNDPLLSTMIPFDDVNLANTVIHEILHNTVWIKNHVSFNESLANFVGSMGAKLYFIGAGDPAKATQAQDRWDDELTYARFLEDLKKQLDSLYQQNDALGEDEILAQRTLILAQAEKAWLERSVLLKTKQYSQAVSKLNNAAILAQHTYLDRPWVFEDLYQALDQSLLRFLAAITELAVVQDKEGTDPYQLVIDRTAKVLKS